MKLHGEVHVKGDYKDYMIYPERSGTQLKSEKEAVIKTWSSPLNEEKERYCSF